jgi:hypothetical protein
MGGGEGEQEGMFLSSSSDSPAENDDIDAADKEFANEGI